MATPLSIQHMPWAPVKAVKFKQGYCGHGVGVKVFDFEDLDQMRKEITLGRALKHDNIVMPRDD